MTADAGFSPEGYRYLEEGVPYLGIGSIIKPPALLGRGATQLLCLSQAQGTMKYVTQR